MRGALLNGAATHGQLHVEQQTASLRSTMCEPLPHPLAATKKTTISWCSISTEASEPAL